ncbi:MAG: hypothetical protein KDD78_03090 [Caldilineaceae bacterium]|nr:hypothetical protein [Caldilineaceae bacterium]
MQRASKPNLVDEEPRATLSGDDAQFGADVDGTTLDVLSTGTSSAVSSGSTVSSDLSLDNELTDLAQLEDAQAAEALDALRGILLEQYRERLGGLQGEVAEHERIIALLEDQINDKEGLLAVITPVLADAINTSIRDSRDEMIEALYPITGRLVTRAVSEAMRDLMRNIDNQMRNNFSVDSFKRRVQARTSGVSDAELAVRTALPFEAEELFLIHRDSGLLLHYVSRDPTVDSDSDLISGMLTAIRDFVQDAFGRGQAGELDEVQYGQMRILIEVGKYAYIAAVVQGYEPLRYRPDLREQLYNIEHDYYRVLREFSGDLAELDGVDAQLQPLLGDITAPVSDANTSATTTRAKKSKPTSPRTGSTALSTTDADGETSRSMLFYALATVAAGVLLFILWRLLAAVLANIVIF